MLLSNLHSHSLIDKVLSNLHSQSIIATFPTASAKVKIFYSDYPAFHRKYVWKIWYYPLKDVRFLIANNMTQIGYHQSGTFESQLKNVDFMPYVRISKLYSNIQNLWSNRNVSNQKRADDDPSWRSNQLINFFCWFLKIPTFLKYGEKHVQNWKSPKKSYAVFLPIIWRWKYQTFKDMSLSCSENASWCRWWCVSHPHSSEEN